MTNDNVRKIRLEGAKLSLYIDEMKKNLLNIQSLSWFERNPYIHSYNANKYLKELEVFINECTKCIMSYTAYLSCYQICSKEELQAYSYIYMFLFQFRDPILKQECIHCILIKKKNIISKFYEFFSYSEQFIKKQNKKLDVIIL